MKAPAWSGYLEEVDPQPSWADVVGFVGWAKSKQIEITGFGHVQGIAPDYTHTVDIDSGDYLERLVQIVKEKTNFDLLTLARQRSGRAGVPGYHLVFRTDGPIAKQKLAMRVADGSAHVIAELIGKGGQAVRAPSKHKSGNLYAVEHGDLANAPHVPMELALRTLEAIRSLDEVPAVVREARTHQHTFRPSTVGESVIDAYNASHSITDWLDRLGYQCTGDEWYRHPNRGENERSVHVLENAAFHFSPNDPAARYGLDCRGGVLTTPFAHFLHHEHGNDLKKAVRAAAEQLGMAHEKLPEFERLDFGGVIESVADELSEAAPPTADQIIHGSLPIESSFYPDSFWRWHNWFFQHTPNINVGISAPTLLAFTGAMLGKHLWSANFGIEKNYSNLSVLNLFETGEGKGPVKNRIDNAIKHLSLEADLDLSHMVMSGGTPEAFITFLGGSQSMSTPRKGEQKETIKEAMHRVIRMCQQRLHGQVVHIDEAQDRLGKLVGEQLSNGTAPWANMGTYLDAHMPGAGLLGERVVGSGWRGYDDACVSSILYAQPSTFMQRYPLERLRGINFTARYVPNLVPIERPHLDISGGQKVWDKLVNLLASDRRIQARIDEADKAWGPNGILSTLPTMLRMKDMSEQYFKDMLNKLSRLAGQMAQVFSWIESWDDSTMPSRDGFDNWGGEISVSSPELDANKYFRQCLELVARCHYNLLYCGGISGDSTVRMRIVEKLKTSRCTVTGANWIMPVRSLINLHFNWRQRAEVMANLQILDDLGIGRFVEHKFCGSRKKSECFQLLK